MSQELERRPHSFAAEYLRLDRNRKQAIAMNIPEAARRHAEAMRQVWDSIPEHLISMVESHVKSERERNQS